MHYFSTILLLIPHYNNPEGLEASLESIKEETLLNVLVVDDGSKSDLLFEHEQIRSKFKDKLNLHFVFLKQNQGIEGALNQGLDYAKKHKYTYIARLDCDDLCYPNRFKIQYEYLVANPSIKLLGTQVKHINERGQQLYISNLPLTHKDLKKAFYINCEIYHPTVMFDLQTIIDLGMYPTNYPAAEDYALFFDVLNSYKVENLDLVLVDKLIDDKSISSRNRKKQIKSRIRVIKKHFYFGITPIYGILRSIFLYFLPRSLVTTLNSILAKGS